MKNQIMSAQSVLELAKTLIAGNVNEYKGVNYPWTRKEESEYSGRVLELIKTAHKTQSLRYDYVSKELLNIIDTINISLLPKISRLDKYFKN